MKLLIYADNNWSLSPVTLLLFTAGGFWFRYLTVNYLTNPLICLDVITKLYSTLHRLTYWQIFRRVRQIARGDYQLRHVCPSVSVISFVHLFSWLPQKGFLWNYLLSIFRKIFQGDSSFIISDENNVYFTLHQYTFMILSRSFLLKIKNISKKICRENQNTHFMFNNVFSRVVPFMG